MKQLVITVAILAALAALSFAGNGDYEAAMMEQDNYCERVALNIHRHFNKDIDCNDANEGEQDGNKYQAAGIPNTDAINNIR
jgi:hypothetical protein